MLPRPGEADPAKASVPSTDAVTGPERLWRVLSKESTGGLLLVGTAAAALVWANSPWYEYYFDLLAYKVGPEALHLDLSLSAWAADGALAIFFFLVGLEIKHELTVGALRNPREAGVPVIAALGGMVVPALVFVAVLMVADQPQLLGGWAIPTATDIAFALAVLALFGRGLPSALRLFLLTLAVVDDLLAVSIIALVYTDDLSPLWFVLSAITVAVFGLAVRRPRPRSWLLLLLAFAAWVLMHESGVHATITGVLLGAVVPATAVGGEEHSRVHWLETITRPLSAAFALPAFAFLTAGVRVVGETSATTLLTEPLTIAIAAGLIVGKLIGITGGAALACRLPGLRLPEGLTLKSLVPVAFLAAIGFTVSLLISELSYADAAVADTAKVAVLLASVTSALLAVATMKYVARTAAKPRQVTHAR